MTYLKDAKGVHLKSVHTQYICNSVWWWTLTYCDRFVIYTFLKLLCVHLKVKQWYISITFQFFYRQYFTIYHLHFLCKQQIAIIKFLNIFRKCIFNWCNVINPIYSSIIWKKKSFKNIVWEGKFINAHELI